MSFLKQKLTMFFPSVLVLCVLYPSALVTPCMIQEATCILSIHLKYTMCVTQPILNGHMKTATRTTASVINWHVIVGRTYCNRCSSQWKASTAQEVKTQLNTHMLHLVQNQMSFHIRWRYWCNRVPFEFGFYFISSINNRVTFKMNKLHFPVGRF